MLSSPHSWQPRLARPPGSSQRLNRVAPAAKRYWFTSPRSSIWQFRLTDHTKQHFPRSRNVGYTFSAHRISWNVPRLMSARDSLRNVILPFGRECFADYKAILRRHRANRDRSGRHDEGCVAIDKNENVTPVPE